MGGPKTPDYVKTEGDFAREDAIRKAAEMKRFQTGRTSSTILAKPTNLSSGTPLVGSGPIQ